MDRKTTFTWLIVLEVALLGAGVIGVATRGGGTAKKAVESAPAPADIVQKAYAQLASKGTVHTIMVQTVDTDMPNAPAGGGLRVTTRSEGFFNYSSSSGRTTIKTEGTGMPGALAASSCETLTIAETTYYTIAPAVASRYPRKKYLKVKTSAPSIQAPAGPQGAPKRIGTAKIDGVAVTKYRIAIDTQSAANSVPQEFRGQTSQGLSLIGRKLPIEYWVDDTGLLRRIVLEFSRKVSAGEQEATTTIHSQTDYKDFGAPVDVTPPPAAQVQDSDLIGAVSACLGQTTGGLGGGIPRRTA